MNAKKLLLLVAACVLCLGVVCGCSQGNQSSSSSSSATSAEPQLQEIGVKGDGAYAIESENGLGQDVVAIQIKKSGTEEYGASLIPEGGKIAAGEKFILYVTPDGTEVENYDVLVTLADGNTLSFSTLDLLKLTSVVLCYGDGVAYIDFVNADKVSGSTKQAVLDAIAAAEAEAQAAAEAEAEAQAAAAAKKKSNNGSGSGSSGGSSAPSQSADQCVPGGVVFR